MSILILSSALYHWYKKLPPTMAALYAVSLFKLRFFSSIHELSTIFFTSNFLIPFFAFYFGPATAGPLKLSFNLVHSITTVLHKIFGSSTVAYLASMKKETLSAKQQFFTVATSYLYQTLYGILIFFIINYQLIIAIKNNSYSTVVTTIIAALYFTICFLENFTMLYEKFFINEGLANYLCALNLCIFALTACTLTFLHGSLLAPLIGLVCLRILFLGMLWGLSFFLWRLQPSWRMHRGYLGLTFIFSILFFLAIQAFY
jgi:hypothetical protein